MNKYLVYKLTDGSVLALSDHHNRLFKPEWISGSVVYARNEAEAGVKFAIKWLLDQETLKRLIEEYLEERNWTLSKNHDIPADNLLALDELLENPVISHLKRVDAEDIVYWESSEANETTD